MKSLFVTTDPHGCDKEFDEILSYWNPDHEQLIVLGDLEDRGSGSRQVIQDAKRLADKYGAIFLYGNHEEAFLNWLDYPNMNFTMFAQNGGLETIKSIFFGENPFERYLIGDVANMIKSEFEEEIQFLRERPLYHEEGDYLFVHAGVNLDLKDWKNTNREDFFWIRDPFHYGRNETGKTIVFGHTPTPLLHKDDENFGVWHSPCGTKIGLDGGCFAGGQMNAIRIQDGLITETISVPSKSREMSQKG